MKQKNLVYDLPTRLFHWIFAFLFVFAFAIAKTVDSESLTFSYHMMAGLSIGFIVLLRVIWGFFGSKHARFSQFALNPRDLINYFKGIFSGKKDKWAGHNPASSWAAIVMLFLAFSLAASGIQMASGLKEELEDIHEILANIFLVVAISHVAGIILHTLRHKELIGLSMLNGKKQEVAANESIAKNYWPVALVFILTLVGFNSYISNNFNPNTRELNLFGKTLQLGETENEDEKKASFGEEEDQTPSFKDEDGDED